MGDNQASPTSVSAQSDYWSVPLILAPYCNNGFPWQRIWIPVDKQLYYRYHLGLRWDDRFMSSNRCCLSLWSNRMRSDEKSEGSLHDLPRIWQIPGPECNNQTLCGINKTSRASKGGKLHRSLRIEKKNIAIDLTGARTSDTGKKWWAWVLKRVLDDSHESLSSWGPGVQIDTRIPLDSLLWWSLCVITYHSLGGMPPKQKSAFQLEGCTLDKLPWSRIKIFPPSDKHPAQRWRESLTEIAHFRQNVVQRQRDEFTIISAAHWYHHDTLNSSVCTKWSAAEYRAFILLVTFSLSKAVWTRERHPT